MSINLMGYGSGNQETRYFAISRNAKGEYTEGEHIRVGTLLLRLDEIPELIEQLSEWVEETA